MILLDRILEHSWGRVWRYFAGGEGSKLNICDHKGSMLVSQDVKKCLFCFGWILVLKFFTKFNAVRVIRFAWSSEIWTEVIVALSSRSLKSQYMVCHAFVFILWLWKQVHWFGSPNNCNERNPFLTNNVDIEQMRTSFMAEDHLLLGYLSR